MYGGDAAAAFAAGLGVALRRTAGAPRASDASASRPRSEALVSSRAPGNSPGRLARRSSTVDRIQSGETLRQTGARSREKPPPSARRRTWTATRRPSLRRACARR